MSEQERWYVSQPIAEGEGEGGEGGEGERMIVELDP